MEQSSPEVKNFLIPSRVIRLFVARVFQTSYYSRNYTDFPTNEVGCCYIYEFYKAQQMC